MADYVKIKKSLLTAIADAIRTKFALGGTYTPAQMAEAINNVVIDGDAINENKFITGAWTEYSNDAVAEINSGAFSNSANLVSVDFPNVTTVKGDNVFENCTSLVSINFPKLITVTGMWMFKNCTKLTVVCFPSLTRVGSCMFQDCSSLTTVDLPVATTLGLSGFNRCTALVSLILRNSTLCTRYVSISTVNDGLDYTPIASGTGYVYVPAALVDTYKADTNWSTYANQIRAIEDYPDICGS